MSNVKHELLIFYSASKYKLGFLKKKKSIKKNKINELHVQVP